MTEGTLTLAALAAVGAIAFGSPTHYWWYTVLPLGLLLPALLAAHCRPVFAAAAALILGFAVVWTTTFGIGALGELPSLPDRAYAARATLLAISIYTLVLAALFAERRHNEAALRTAIIGSRAAMIGFSWLSAVPSSASGALTQRLAALKATHGIGKFMATRLKPYPKRSQQHGLSSIPATYQHWTPPSLLPSVLVAAARSNTVSLRLSVARISATSAG